MHPEPPMISAVAPHAHVGAGESLQNCRVALLTNFVPPYLVPLYECLAKRVQHLRVFISTQMESDRSWKPNWGTLEVEVLRGFQFRSQAHHPHEFREELFVHVPLDTYQRLRSYKPDVIIACQLGIRSLQAVVYTLLNRRSRLVFWLTISEYSELSRGKLRTLFRKILIPRASAIIVNGNSGARYLKKLAPNCNKIFLAPYSSHANPPKTSLLRRTNRLIYVGQLIERKGILPFVSVLKRWAQTHPTQQLEFLVVGEGPLRPSLEQIQTPPNLKMIFAGQFPYEGMPEIFGTCSILAFPTLADEWGLVVNEALAAGLPVLGSIYSQAVEELVKTGVNGWVFRPDNPEETLLAIDQALALPEEELRKMRKMAVDSVSHLKPDLIAERVEAAVRHALGSEVGRDNC